MMGHLMETRKAISRKGLLEPEITNEGLFATTELSPQLANLVVV